MGRPVAERTRASALSPRSRPGPRARLELGMELAPDEPGVVRQLDHLDERTVGGQAGAAHPVFRQHVAVSVGYLVAVPVALAHLHGAVDLRRAGAGPQLTRIGA